MAESLRSQGRLVSLRSSFLAREARFRRRAWLLAAVLPTACSDSDSGSVEVDSAEWSTEAEYSISGSPEQDVLFSQVAVILVDPYRNRVFVLDAQDAEVSVWTPEGSLVFAVGGKGEGPGEFVLPTRIAVVDSSTFYVREGFGSRFTYYASDGTLKGTVPGVPASLTYRDYPLTVEAPTGTGGYLALPQIGSRHFVDRGIERYPLVHVRQSDNGEWIAPEPIFWLDSRNRSHPIKLGEDRTAWMGQSFGDSDLRSIEPGRAVVGRRTGGAGVVELIELAANGDTTWVRRLQLEPQRLTSEMIREQGDYLLANITIPGVAPLRLRQAWEEGLYRPEYLPAARNMLLTTSGEVWLTTFERSDTLAVYYAIRRGDTTGQPRRVLLPQSLWLHDATETHVWGVWRDSLGVPYVVGRRLVSG